MWLTNHKQVCYSLSLSLYELPAYSSELTLECSNNKSFGYGSIIRGKSQLENQSCNNFTGPL